jgi:TonB family protein
MKAMKRILSLLVAGFFVFATLGAAQDGAKGPAREGGKTAAKSEDVTKPEVLTKVQPKYPEEAKKNGIQGAVVVKAKIDKQGDVVDAVAAETPDPDLAKAAIEAVKQWKFKPALDKKGKPVEVKTSVTINFKLQ